MDQITGLLTADAIDTLLEYDWPGNVREMANVMEHAWIVAGGQRITSDHLPRTLLNATGTPSTLPLKRPEMPTEPRAMEPELPTPARTLKEIEKDHIYKTLEKHGGNKAAAAAELGIVLKTLYNKLNAWEDERAKNAG